MEKIPEFVVHQAPYLSTLEYALNNPPNGYYTFQVLPEKMGHTIIYRRQEVQFSSENQKIHPLEADLDDWKKYE